MNRDRLEALTAVLIATPTLGILPPSAEVAIVLPLVRVIRKVGDTRIGPLARNAGGSERFSETVASSAPSALGYATNALLSAISPASPGGSGNAFTNFTENPN